jgi:predicted enzyme related to lactoylglutathione lyase
VTEGNGQIVWRDLTVVDAVGVRDFYASVLGWKFSEVSMGEYSDFNVLAGEGGEPIAGVCHSRGPNADVPPVWLMYVLVADVQAACAAAVSGGGGVVAGPRKMGGGWFAVVRDPAGAMLAVYQK